MPDPDRIRELLRDQEAIDRAVRQGVRDAISRHRPHNVPLAAMKDAMKAHLDQTLKEAVDRLQNKYADDIKDYDAVHAHILDMADALSAGVIAQFPDKFK